MSLILLLDADEALARPLTRFRSRFSVRDGIFTPLERLRLKHSGASFFYFHPDAAHEASIARIEGLEPARLLLGEEPRSLAHAEELATHRNAAIVPAAPLLDLLDGIGERLLRDIELWQGAKRAMHSANALAQNKVELIGDAAQLHASASAEIMPGVVLDTRNGPIVLDENVRISPFSYLQGPLYIGPNARIDNARLSGGGIFGKEARIGGEVERSLFGDFSNKHHEGFVGHSLVGAWVNLGAMTTTSDLKNNYGEVRPLQPPSAMELEKGQRAAGAPALSGRIKLGAIIGDAVKTAIGTMLTTGSVIDAGCSVFGGAPPRYLPPLSWGIGGERYRSDRFFQDCSRIFARRGQSPHAELAALAARFSR